MPATAYKLDPFIEAKVRLWYRYHNKKRNGFIGREDCIEMAETFTKEFQLDDETSNDLYSWLVDGWSALIEFSSSVENGVCPMSAEKTPFTLLVAEKMANNGAITEDMYINAFSEILELGRDFFCACFSKMVGIFFDVFDTDKDGCISRSDMVKGLGCFGITNSSAVEAVFEELDTKKEGKIDKDTYVSAWLEYMTGKDQNAPMAKHFTPETL